MHHVCDGGFHGIRKGWRRFARYSQGHARIDELLDVSFAPALARRGVRAPMRAMPRRVGCRTRSEGRG